MGTALLQKSGKSALNTWTDGQLFPWEQSDRISSTSHADGCHPISCIAQQS